MEKVHGPGICFEGRIKTTVGVRQHLGKALLLGLSNWVNIGAIYSDGKPEGGHTGQG